MTRSSNAGLYGIGFTGSREIPNDHRTRTRLRDVMEDIFYDDDLPDMFEVTTGGCIGIDAFVAHWCRRHAITVHTVLPPWRGAVDPDWRSTCNTHEDIPSLGPNDRTGYKRRNQRIVELSDRLIAFPLYAEDDSRSRGSGTWQTVRLGREKGIVDPADIHVLSSYTE